MKPETQEAVQATLSVLKAGDGTRRHGELLERVIRELTAERDEAREETKVVRKVAAADVDRAAYEAMEAALDRVRKVAANPRSTHGMVRDYVKVTDLRNALGSGT